MTDLQTLEQIQADLNQQIYHDLLNYLEITVQTVDNAQAFNLLISAVATNLGAILAQVPDAYRNDFIKIVNGIISQSLTETLKTVDNINWGQIGHA